MGVSIMVRAMTHQAGQSCCHIDLQSEDNDIVRFLHVVYISVHCSFKFLYMVGWFFAVFSNFLRCASQFSLNIQQPFHTLDPEGSFKDPSTSSHVEHDSEKFLFHSSQVLFEILTFHSGSSFIMLFL